MEQLIVAVLVFNALALVGIVTLIYIVDFRPYLKQITRMKLLVEQEGNEQLKQSKEIGEEMIRATQVRNQLVLEDNQKMLTELSEKIRIGVEESVSKSKDDIHKVTLLSTNIYQEEMKEMNVELRKFLADTKEKVSLGTLDAVKNLLKQIEVEAADSHRQLEEQINVKLQKLEEDLAAEKERRTQELYQHIFEIISEVARRVIGESVDVATHEKLVLEQLEKVKKEKILTNG